MPTRRHSSPPSGTRPPARAGQHFASAENALCSASATHSRGRMESPELKENERRARRAYEAARLRRAVLAFAPILLLVTATALTGHRFGYTLAFGSALFALGVALLWYGLSAKQAVLPGVAAGLVPLLFALCARQMNHACGGDHCLMFCVPACLAGGVIAGIVVGSIGVRTRRGFGFWLAASGVCLLTGAMGCACVGLPGVMGLALGYMLTTV